MHKPDQIQLAILALIIDSPDANGRMLVLPQPTSHSDVNGRVLVLSQLTSYFEEKVGPCNVREIVEELIVLSDSQVISVGKYRGSDFVPRQPYEGEAYFYQNFMCKALPGARRRMAELSAEARTGIFISHIGEARTVALRLKAFVEIALRPAPPVFVSSDYVSIESGEEWYRAILQGLRKSLAVIVLLSPNSVERRWINFEAGFGLGQGSRVIPVVWRGLAKSDVDFPLSHFQARELASEPELQALFKTLASLSQSRFDETLLPRFAQEVARLNDESIQLNSKPRRSAAEQERYQIAESGIEKLGPTAVKVLKHLHTVGKYADGIYSPPPPSGLNGNQMREMLAALVEAQLVRYDITNRDERTYEIPPSMSAVLDELLYR